MIADTTSKHHTARRKPRNWRRRHEAARKSAAHSRHVNERRGYAMRHK